MGFISDLHDRLDGARAAPGTPDPRARGDGDCRDEVRRGPISPSLERCLAAMEAAESTQAFIAADAEFHGIIVAASGNSTLASLIQNLSGGTLRARIWRSVIEQDAIETHQAAPLGHLRRPARSRRRAGARGRPDSPLGRRALARAADRARRGDRRARRIPPQRERLRLSGPTEECEFAARELRPNGPGRSRTCGLGIKSPPEHAAVNCVKRNMTAVEAVARDPRRRGCCSRCRTSRRVGERWRRRSRSSSWLRYADGRGQMSSGGLA